MREMRPAAQQERAIATREAILKGAGQVFSQLSYAQARLRDISRASAASEGALYFHYGTKADIATAVISAQQERMTDVLMQVVRVDGDALDKIGLLAQGLAELIARDVVVQGGIRLTGQPNLEVAPAVNEPYFDWVRIVRTLISQGVDEGSIRLDVDIDAAAELVNTVFVGSQVLSGLEDNWKSLPRRVETLRPLWISLLRRTKTQS